MCGILGVYGNIDHRLHSAFEVMLTLSQVRGTDSTGVAAIGDKTVIVKDTVFALDLLKKKEYLEGVLKNKNKCLIGHNRAQTKGVVSKANAHPFQYKHIVLVHNGTLWDNIENTKKTETDSESICVGIAEKGIDAVWSELKGDAAILYYDLEKNNINFITNGKRPIVFAYTKDFRTLILASERKFIDLVVEHYNIALYKNDVWSPKDNQLWTLSLERHALKEASRMIEPYIYKARIPNNYNQYSRFIDHHGWEDTEYDENLKGYTVKTTGVSDVPFINSVSPSGLKDVKYKTQKIPHQLSKEEFLTHNFACFACGDGLEYEASSIINGTPVCDGCISVAEDNNIMIAGMRGA